MIESTSVTQETADRNVTRRQLVLGGATLGGAFLLSGFAGKTNQAEAAAAEYWYEIVQDLKDPSLWHLNLFGGNVRGDLSRSTLVEHFTRTGEGVDSIKHGLEFPWRIQGLDGHKEQSF